MLIKGIFPEPTRPDPLLHRDRRTSVELTLLADTRTPQVKAGRCRRNERDPDPFQNEEGKIRARSSIRGGEALVVSQFTLIADTGKGNRPSFGAAAPAERAEPLYERFCHALEELGIEVARGVFGAWMSVALSNDGPATIVLDG